MNERIEKAFAYLDRHEEDMIRLWKNLVTMESPSADREANERIAAHLDTYCDALGMERQIYHFEKAGPVFAAWTKSGKWKPIMLLGHTDTVHAVGKFGENPFFVDGDVVRGPGVYDMKGGDAIALYALQALHAIGYEDRQIKLLLTSDEEVAHAFSSGDEGQLVELHAEGCEAAFNLESGGKNEEVTLQRKGGAVLKICVYGKAAHAGKEPEKGASAILQAARMIVEIESKTCFGGLTYNCGKISGGSGANIIPDYCEFSIGIRYVTNEQYEEAIRLIEDLCRNTTVPGTRCTMEQNGYYPAMEIVPGTERIFEAYKESCRILGCRVPESISQGGCSDSAFVTRIGVPTLCSLGVQGDGAHSLEEKAYINSLLPQCKKLVAAILLLS